MATANSSQYAYLYDPNISENALNLSLDQMNGYWDSNSTNSTVLLKIRYSYSLPITSWQIIDNDTTPIFLPNQTNTFSRTYYETFTINDPNMAQAGLTPTNFNASISYIPAYTNKVNYLSTWAAAAGSPTYYHFSNFDHAVNTTLNNVTWITNASASYQIFYSANFTVAFGNVLQFPFAVDRLAQNGDTRERWYYLNVTKGPPGLCISNYIFNDTDLNYPDILNNVTNFGRPLLSEWNNVTANVSDGVTFVGGYLAPGETDVVIVTYTASASLSLVIADQTDTPLSGAVVKLFWNNMTYGTYMSQKLNVTLAPKLSDSAGNVQYTSVPADGNYSVVVQYEGNTYGPYLVSTSQTVNLVTTAIPHLPTWVISFASFCGLIFVIGYWRYRKFRQQ
jgi:hypothetical protein